MADKSDNLQPWVISVTSAMTVLALFSCGLRLLARHERKQSLWWDDWMILWSMGWNLVVVGFIFGMIGAGMGLHADTVSMENIVLMAKLLLVAEILYVYNLVWTKLSFVLMFYRIFRFAYFKRWAYIIGGFVIAWVICITFLFIFICVPVQKLWYPQLPGHCIDQVGTWIANAASTILTDLAILIVPLPQVWKLKLRTSRKIAVLIAFGLGFFVVFASVYRFTVLFSYDKVDSTYTLAPTVGWTAIEMSAGIVSANLPVMRPALIFIARKLGIQKALPSFFRGGSAEDEDGKDTGTNSSKFTGTDDTASRRRAGRNRKANRDSFHRLPDDMDQAGTNPDMPFDPTPGTTKNSCVSTVARGIPEGSDASTDGTMLHSIHVQRDFTQTESR